MTIFNAALERGLLGRGQHKGWQTGQLIFRFEHQLKFTFVGERILAKARVERGELLHHLAVALLVGRRELGASADKIQMDAFEQATLLCIQTQCVALSEERVDAREQCGISIDGIVMGGQRGRHFAFDRLQFGRGLRGSEIGKHHLDAFEQSATFVECRKGVVERRGLWIVTDGGQFAAVFQQRLVEAGLEVCRAD